jgi:hypothetical protein
VHHDAVVELQSAAVAVDALELAEARDTSGSRSIGPKRDGPMKPVVVVLTPSMDLARYEVSST